MTVYILPDPDASASALAQAEALAGTLSANVDLLWHMVPHTLGDGSRDARVYSAALAARREVIALRDLLSRLRTL